MLVGITSFMLKLIASPLSIVLERESYDERIYGRDRVAMKKEKWNYLDRERIFGGT